MLEYFVKRKTKLENILIVANLPYVSENIYKKNYKNLKYEPKKALFSENKGLGYYLKFFKQLKKNQSECYMLHVTCFVEFSPEQKPGIGRIFKKYWPKAKIAFFKDLAGKWRVAMLSF